MVRYKALPKAVRLFIDEQLVAGVNVKEEKIGPYLIRIYGAKAYVNGNLVVEGSHVDRMVKFSILPPRFQSWITSWTGGVVNITEQDPECSLVITRVGVAYFNGILVERDD